MLQKLVISVDVAFGLAFDIEQTEDRASGFKPASYDLGSGKELFGQLRLDGFASLLRVGFAKHLVVIGGNEARYRDGSCSINRAWAIREMLVKDCGIDPTQVSDVASQANTKGNVIAMTKWVEQTAQGHEIYAVVSNAYHLPRALVDLVEANLHFPLYPVEAFFLLEDWNHHKEILIKRLGEGSLAERIAEEMQGIAHKLCGTYGSLPDLARSVDRAH